MQRVGMIVSGRSLVVAVAVGAVLWALLAAVPGESATMEVQDPADVLEAQALAIGDPAGGEIRTYDPGGTPASSVGGFAEGDQLDFAHAIPIVRDRNIICTVHANANTGNLDFCANQDQGIVRFTGADFSAGDALATANLTGLSEDLDEVLIGRADTGEIEVWRWHPDPEITMERVSSFQAGFAAGDTIVVADPDDFRFRDEFRIVVFHHGDQQLRFFDRAADDDVFAFEQSGVPNPVGPFDDVAVGTVDPFDDPMVAMVDAGGRVTLLESWFGPEVASFPTAYRPGDQILIADIHANTTGSVLIADAETGEVEVHAYTFDADDPIHQVESLDLGVAPGAQLAAHDPVMVDTSGDGLMDVWKQEGLDANGDGHVDVDLPGKGVDPLDKDLFVEYDWMRFREPSQEGIEEAVEAFGLAPVNAGATAHPGGERGINLHVDTGNVPGAALRGGNELVDESGARWTRAICDLDDAFYDAKRINFDPRRSLVYRYAISAERCPGGSVGRGEVGGNDMVIWNADQSPIRQASTFMHELGHNMDLRHGGFEDHNCKPNYVSIMSYGLPVIERADGTRIVDFSPPRIDDEGNRGTAPLDPLDEHDLDETVPLDADDPVNLFVFRDGQGDLQPWPLNDPVDWTGDGQHVADPDPVNIDHMPEVSDECDREGELGVVNGYNDWSNVSLPFQHFEQSASGPINPSDPHRTPDDITEYMQQLNETDLTIAHDVPDTVVAGEQVDVTLEVTNEGPRRALDVRVDLELPDGLAHADDDADCDAGDDAVTCDLGTVDVDEAREIGVTADVDPAVVHDAGGATILTVQATVGSDDEFFRERDVDSAQAQAATEVVGESDLEVVSASAPDAPVDVLLAGDATAVDLDTVVANHGPSGPTDVALAVDAAASGGVDVDLVDGHHAALGLDEARPVTDALMITCAEAGRHAIDVVVSLEPATRDVTDPHPAQASATVPIEVECVVPVAIDIRPGDDQAPVNLRSRGVIPVAVLSTDAGEHGLPRDFDATEIDPATVRFGRAENLFGVDEPVGAPVEQERTHDGRDVMMRFRTQETGLQEDDTQACLRGETHTDADGGAVAFFGCDGIVVRS